MGSNAHEIALFQMFPSHKPLTDKTDKISNAVDCY
jgi:hypothetical protein